jgi:membrane protease YdiL (CAAX protease family)
MIRPITATIILFILLVVATFLFSKVTFSARVIIVLIFYILLAFLVLRTRVSPADLGLDKASIMNGLKLAVPFMMVLFLGAVILAFIAPSVFQDERYQQSLGAMLFMVAITIPFMTVIIEELAFRGVLLGTLLHTMTPLQANLVSAASFGLWHFFTAQAVNISVFSIPQWLVVVGVIVATTVAGLFFGWLRLRSGSVVAPVLVHWTINAAGVIAAFIAWPKES